MEAIEENLLWISVIVIALIKFPEYASGFKQTLPSQMLKESDRKTCERFMHQEENKLIKGMKPKAKEKKPFDASLVLKDDGSIGLEVCKKTSAKSKEQTKIPIQLIGLYYERAYNE
ncbi:hypothetical protein ACIQX3_25855 [Peribacillus frigoritolerans]|uniref:hypothetical protein n=1 Tax=Peribacillus frigoritolerans TaxID=450367 RepID=UPI00382AA0E6